MRLTALLVTVAPIALALLAPPLAAQSPEAVAAAALEAAPVWDGHNDAPMQVRVRRGNVLEGFDFANTQAEPDSAGSDEHSAMHTDLPRLREGRVGAQFWSVYVSASLPEPKAVVTTIEQIDITKRLIAAYPDDLALALTADEVEAAMAQGKIASLIGMEGGYSIASSLGVLRQMYALGARYMTLTHNANTPWADSASAAPEHDGLTEFGVQLVQEMARMGMLIDLSHVSEATMLDALDATDAPVIFSHSGARAVSGHARNVPDSVLARLPANGGIVMVVALPGFINEELRQHNARRAGVLAETQALWLGQPQAVAEAMARFDQENPTPLSTVSDVADHIDHIRQVAGIDHIGIGGDYDGMPSGPVGMEDVSGYPALFVELARRGYSQDDLEKIASRNMMRVMRGAEAFAASQASLPPIETPVG